MVTKQELEKRLFDLRQKWKNDYPKNDLDKRWWKFRCDKTMALQIIEQIKKIDAGVEITVAEMPDDQIAEYFK